MTEVPVNITLHWEIDRATSAKTFLVDLGISASRLTTISYGEERPVDLGKSEEAWAKNRRCHFTIN